MAAADFSGRVVTVIDGDTVRVLTSKRIIKVRLYGIDCPEKKQPFGKEAKKALRQRVFGKVVNFQERDKARDGLAVAVLMTPDGRDVNRELVQAGSCWALEDHVADYAKDMQEAREARRGLWQDPNPISPENWRRIKQRKGKAEKLPVIPGEIGTEPPTEF
jgi:endonuclease YncB( thermonuclease family)